MRSTHRENYLSPEYQKHFINCFISRVNRYVPRGRNSTLDELIEGVGLLTESTLNILGGDLKEETKNERSLNNNTVLKEYFSKLKEFYFNNEARLKGDDYTDHWAHLLKFCHLYENLLDKIIDISIYKVRIPQEKYKEIATRSNMFFIDGTGYTTFAIAVNAISLLPLVCSQIYNVCEQTLFKRNPTFSNYDEENAYKEKKRSLQSNFERFAYTCQINIPPEWIQGKVDKNGETISENTGYISSDSPSYIMYVLNADDPKKIFENGIIYMDPSINPLGYQLMFEKVKIAYSCAQQLEGTLQFDKDCGWRMNHGWTDEELAAPQLQIKTAIKKANILPDNLNGIVEEYLDVSPPRPGR